MSLTAEQRKDLCARFQQDVSAARETFGNLTKQQIADAVAAIDGWLDANIATLSIALPKHVRTGLTEAQVARLFRMVISMRLGGNSNG